jgi:hypothetical protein
MVAELHAYTLKDSLTGNLVLLSMALPKWQYLNFINENQPAKKILQSICPALQVCHTIQHPSI